MEQLIPGLEMRPEFSGVISEHLLPAPAEVEIAGLEVPVPEAIGGAFEDEGELFLA